LERFFAVNSEQLHFHDDRLPGSAWSDKSAPIHESGLHSMKKAIISCKKIQLNCRQRAIRLKNCDHFPWVTLRVSAFRWEMLAGPPVVIVDLSFCYKYLPRRQRILAPPSILKAFHSYSGERLFNFVRGEGHGKYANLR